MGVDVGRGRDGETGAERRKEGRKRERKEGRGRYVAPSSHFWATPLVVTVMNIECDSLTLTVYSSYTTDESLTQTIAELRL